MLSLQNRMVFIWVLGWVKLERWKAQGWSLKASGVPGLFGFQIFYAQVRDVGSAFRITDLHERK